MSESTRIRGDVLFDTNAASAFIRKIPEMVSILDPLCQVFLPLAVVGELLYGAHYAARPEAQLLKVREFAADTSVLFPDQATAEIYGRIKADLRRLGSMIPENDLWIAATAIQHDLLLLTQDIHFRVMPEVNLLTW